MWVAVAGSEGPAGPHAHAPDPGTARARLDARSCSTGVAHACRPLAGIGDRAYPPGEGAGSTGSGVEVPPVNAANWSRADCTSDISRP
jgi:hypothetical protein